MITNYILDTKNNILEICSKKIEKHELSSYNSKVLQVLANNELNSITSIHKFIHHRSRWMIYMALALFDGFGLEIEIINDACKMKTQIWIK